MIQTVRGLIKKEELGVTMAHEHLVLNLSHVRMEDDSVFMNKEEIIAEVMHYKVLGGQSMIEVTGIDMGRNPVLLQQISEATDMHVVASTGFYLRPYHPQWLEEASIDEIAELFIKEITVGIGETGIKAGLIGEVATSSGMIHPCEEKVLRAAARAAVKTGVAVTTHCDRGVFAMQQYIFLTEEGMQPNKIILGHMDLTTDTAYHESLLEKGVTLGFDTIGKTAYVPDEERANCLLKLIDKGYSNQLVLSQDISRRSYFKANGGGGYTLVLDGFVKRLKAKGIDPKALHQMLVENPATLLDKE